MTAPAILPATDQLSDEEVVRRVVAGETALFEILMRRYNQRVYRVVRSIIRDDEQAEDVVQQAYVQAYVHLRQFADRAKFSTWLTRIAINEAFARVRRRFPRLAEISEVEMNEIASPQPDPETEAAVSQLRDVLESEIAALPESYRTIIALREIEGLSTAETAECLDVSEDVVKTRLHRARGLLRENLFRRAGGAFEQLYPFGNARCDRVVAAVMQRITTSAPR